MLLRHVQSWITQSPETTTMDSLHLAAFVGRYDRGHGYIDDVHFHDGHLVAQSTYAMSRGRQVVGYVQQQPDGTIARAARPAAP